jgi:hypothetical protein
MTVVLDFFAARQPMDKSYSIDGRLTATDASQESPSYRDPTIGGELRLIIACDQNFDAHDEALLG